MPPILATDYGNFYAFMTGVPVMIVACSLGVVGLVWKLRALAVLSSLVLFATVVWFLASLGEAREADLSATILVTMVAGAAGLTLLLWKRVPSREGRGD